MPIRNLMLFLAVLFACAAIRVQAVQTVLYDGPYKLNTGGTNTNIGCCDNKTSCCDSIPSNFKEPIDYVHGKVMIELRVDKLVSGHEYFIRFIWGVKAHNTSEKLCYHSIWTKIAPRWSTPGTYRWEAPLGAGKSIGSAPGFYREDQCITDDYALGLFRMLLQLFVDSKASRAPGEMTGNVKVTLVSADDPLMNGVETNHSPYSRNMNTLNGLTVTRTDKHVVIAGRDAGAIVISDMKGRAVYRAHRMNSGKCSIDVSLLPAGMYAVSAEGGAEKCSELFVVE